MGDDGIQVDTALLLSRLTALYKHVAVSWRVGVLAHELGTWRVADEQMPYPFTSSASSLPLQKTPQLYGDAQCVQLVHGKRSDVQADEPFVVTLQVCNLLGSMCR